MANDRAMSPCVVHQSRGEIKEKMKPVDQVNTCKIYIYVTCASNTDL